MGLLDWLVARGHAADIVLAVMAIEAAWLVAAARWPLVPTVARLLPGGLMMVALRAALVGAGWHWIALSLALALPAHLADLAINRPRRKLPGGG